jgi:hypothetical protein
MTQVSGTRVSDAGSEGRTTQSAMGGSAQRGIPNARWGKWAEGLNGHAASGSGG